MTPADFLATRQRLGMSRAAFCRALGLSQNAGTKYEHGRAKIPRYVALACSALLWGLPPVGATLGEVAAIMAWSVPTAARMIETYAALDPALTDGVLVKLEQIKASK